MKQLEGSHLRMAHWVASSTRMYTALLHCWTSDRNSGCAMSVQ